MEAVKRQEIAGPRRYLVNRVQVTHLVGLCRDPTLRNWRAKGSGRRTVPAPIDNH